MNNSTIINNIKSWGLARSNKESQVFKQLFLENSGFFFTIPKTNDDVTGLYYHAYPGIEKGLLKFYLIRSDHDTEEGYNEKYVIEATIKNLTGMDIIPEAIAKERIDTWVKNHNGWIDNQLDSEDSMYLAFGIPIDDVEPGSITVYFALAPYTSEITGQSYNADLILYRKYDGAGESYFNLVRPVPPFKPSPWAKNDFYLLTL
ncbi:hypothetical protein AAEO56_00970 [Flavobacterium sp. DGU11]|uniref:Suppressor of fused protein (SUFU) n=1 Tax=Flavobacterium arundinis TaxID=3139143 RepID=A0ABU9HS61_9FLAO